MLSQMFDVAYFRGTFAERVREFSRDHEDARVRVEIVTLNGDRHDAMQLRATAVGAIVVTRGDRLVFVPYERIEYIEVGILNDRRVEAFELVVD